MKLYIPYKYCLSIFLIFCSAFAFGQTQVDSVVSIKFPGKTKSSELGDSSASASVLYLNTEKESYIIIKSILLKNGRDAKILPTDDGELANIYRHDIENQFPTMRKKGFAFKDSVRINIGGYIAYKLKYTDIKSKGYGAESILLFLNGARYLIMYSEVTAYNQKNGDDFLNSLQIAHSKYIRQIAESDDGISSIFSIVLTALLTMGLLIFFLRASKNKSPFGINLRTVYCPVCNTKQPIIRMPRNIHQLLFGGTTCLKCQSKLDKYGNIIK